MPSGISDTRGDSWDLSVNSTSSVVSYCNNSFTISRGSLSPFFGLLPRKYGTERLTSLQGVSQIDYPPLSMPVLSGLSIGSPSL